ncbi:Collagen alpha-5(VI) chain [Manis javanica]|nr:Collagen alpha-5(VI) chain [Manis javanica]
MRGDPSIRTQPPRVPARVTPEPAGGGTPGAAPQSRAAASAQRSQRSRTGWAAAGASCTRRADTGERGRRGRRKLGGSPSPPARRGTASACSTLKMYNFQSPVIGLRKSFSFHRLNTTETPIGVPLKYFSFAGSLTTCHGRLSLLRLLCFTTVSLPFNSLLRWVQGLRKIHNLPQEYQEREYVQIAGGCKTP